MYGRIRESPAAHRKQHQADILVRAARGRNPAHLLPLPIAENFPRFHLEKCMFASLTFERVGADFLMQPD
jgi:hypothetical protein